MYTKMLYQLKIEKLRSSVRPHHILFKIQYLHQQAFKYIYDIYTHT